MITVIRYDGDTVRTAERINNAVRTDGRRAIATWDDVGKPVVQLIEAGCPTATGRTLQPGEQVVIDGGTWRIEAMADAEVAA